MGCHWTWGVHISLSHYSFVSFEYVPKSGNVGSYSNSIIYLFIYVFTMFKGVTLLNFLRNLYSIFHSGHQFTFPPTVSNGSIFSTSFSAFIISCLFENSYPNRCMLTYYCIGEGGGLVCYTKWNKSLWLWFAISWLLVTLSTFLMCWPFLCLLQYNVYSDSLHIFCNLDYLFAIKLYVFLVFCILIPYHMANLQIRLPFFIFDCVLSRSFFIWCKISYLFREGNGNPLQYSCLENPMDKQAW